jgi:hypothetical protein
MSALRQKFNPRNINHMPVEDPEPLIGAVKFFARLDLEQICLFLDGHYLDKQIDEVALFGGFDGVTVGAIPGAVRRPLVGKPIDAIRLGESIRGSPLRQVISWNHGPHGNCHGEIEKLSSCGHDGIFLIAGGVTACEPWSTVARQNSHSHQWLALYRSDHLAGW